MDNSMAAALGKTTSRNALYELVKTNPSGATKKELEEVARLGAQVGKWMNICYYNKLIRNIDDAQALEAAQKELEERAKKGK